MDYYFSSRQTEDSARAQLLAKELNINHVTASILLARGISDSDGAKRFINCGSANFHDPFLLSGMRSAVDSLNAHIAAGSSVVIYGDYDADGICSVAILYLHFLSLGMDVNWYIPERGEGYGLNTDAIDFIAQNYRPNLIITVDCGVTAVEESEYIKSLGIDLIITDHHNRLPKLPDSIIINPKLSPEYPFSDLCGAGVALKFVQALSGMQNAMQYIDIAAIATIADSVELVGENRDIAAEGIRALNSKTRAGIKELMLAAQISGDINTYTIAFAIVPRINAAGRIGEAKRALGLFYEEDTARLKELAEELNRANAERQQLCESIIKSCGDGIYSRGEDTLHIISVIDDSGQAGISGIVASKLCERYYRPSFVFCRDGDGNLKGSGRSVDGINIFDMLSSMSELFVRFGGHAYAAGVTISEGNYADFLRRADTYLMSEQLRYYFIKKQYYDYDLTGKRITRELIKELELFEPCGVANPRPKFLYTADSISAEALTKHPRHLTFKVSGVEVMAFGYGSDIDVLNSTGKIRLLLEFKTNKYAGREYAKGYLKDFSYGDTSTKLFKEKAALNYISQLCLDSDNEYTGNVHTDNSNAHAITADTDTTSADNARTNNDNTNTYTADIGNTNAATADNDNANAATADSGIVYYNSSQISGMIQNSGAFGTLFVAFCLSAAQKFLTEYPALADFPIRYFSARGSSNATKFLIAPDIGYNMDGYNKVVFLDSPLSDGYLAGKTGGKRLYVPQDAKRNLPVYGDIDLSREAFGQYYKMLTDKAILEKPFVHMANLYYNISKRYKKCSLLMLGITFSVFCELGFITAQPDEPITVNNQQKANLESSKLYQKLQQLTLAGNP